MAPNVKITKMQIRFLLGTGQVWMIQPLHVSDGVPDELRGQYSVPHKEIWDHGWGTLDGAREVEILKRWVKSGFSK